MAIWKARITEVSNIDNSARQDVAFNIVRPNGQLAQIGGQPVLLRATGNPTNIRQHVATVATDFIRELIAAGQLQIGNEVEFDI
jgi:hypothetical protein